MTLSFQVLDERLGSLSEQPALAQLENMGDALDLAPSTGLISALPVAEPTVVGESGSEKSRILTIRNRLHRLGYLDSDSGVASLDESYKSAVTTFQKEARLTRDGWVGDQTWGALQELVSFEEQFNAERWYDGATRRPCAALRRAVQLRLFVLGLARDDPRERQLPFSTALARFAAAGALVGITESGDVEGNEVRLVALLFDLDAMTATLGRATEFAKNFVTRPGNLRGAWLNAALLMVNAAKVELWLAGYDVELNDPRPIVETKLFSAGRRRRWQPNETLGGALNRYWHNRAHSGEIAATESNTRQSRTALLLLHELPLFFQGVAAASAEFDRISDSERSASITEWYERHPEHVETSVRKVDSLRSRLWDGVKRAWSWIKGLIRGAVELVRKFAEDIAAVAHAFAVRTFQRITGAIRAITQTVATVIAKIAPGSAADTIVIARGGDFDYQLFINRNANDEDVRSVAKPLSVSAAHFRRGCEVVGILVHFVIRAISVIGTGGFGLFFALIDIFRTLKPARRIASAEPA